MAFRSPKLTRALVAVVTVLTVVATFGAPFAAAGPDGVVLVGFAPGGDVPAAAFAAGEVLSVDHALGFAAVAVDDVDVALAMLRHATGVAFAEADGTVFATGTRWSSAQADGTRWSSSQSEGTRWSSSEADGTRWSEADGREKENKGVRKSSSVADSSRWDSSRWDSSRWDSVYGDSSRWDSSRWDSSRWDSSHWDSSRWDSSRWDSSRWDSARWDSARWDSARWDSARWDSARWDSTRWDSARWDSTRWDSARWDSTRWDGALCASARWDSARWDASLCDSARWDSARWDGSFELDPLFAYQWGLRDLKVHDAWQYFQGLRGMTVCVVDSGVDHTHPDLAANMWTSPTGTHGYDFVNDDHDPMDDGGHGTHMAGIIAAGVGNGIGVAGVGDERIMAVKVLNDKGTGGNGNLAKGIRYCADNGANVVSLSLSTEQRSQAVKRAVEYAHGKGLLLVASAGNLDTCEDCVTYPAAYPEVVAVTALTIGGEPAAFSRPTDYVDLAAPGYLIASTFPNGEYALGSGTSQAAAFVAGLAALAWDVAPAMSAAELRAHLVASAVDLGTPGWDPFSGAGEPDAVALLLAVHGGP